jgi:two-component system, chemotaxis family, CheB/CheR fusion protein
VLKMAREGLLVSVRSLLERARKEHVVVRESGVRVKSNGGYHEIDLTIVPIGRSTAPDRCFWILFEEPVPVTRPVGAKGAKRGESRAAPRGGARRKDEKDEEKDEQIVRLTQELAATRDYLQSVIEQQEAANEELQSANEEVQSANEELQSINEEIETSKEEIQSSNEELTTVNEELQNRNEELNRANDDLNNIFSGVQMAIVMVWPDLRIRRFTPMAEKLFNLIAADIGRPIGDIQLSLNVNNLSQLLGEVIDTVAVKEQEVQDKHGRWYLLRIRPYRTLDNKIDGAVILLVDIDTLKQNQDVLQRHARMLEQTHDAVFVRETSGAIVYWNHGAEVLYGYSKAEAMRHTITELLGSNDAQRKAVEIALNAKGQWQGELSHRTRDGRDIVVASKQLVFTEGERMLVLDTARDITERRHLEENLRARVDELAAADRHKNEFLAMLAHELRNPMAPLRNAVQIISRAPPESGAFQSARQIVERQVGTLTRLVDDLLDAAHVSRGQVRLRKEIVDLRQVTARAVDSVKEAFESRRHDLQVQLPEETVLLEGDPVRLEQVIVNLLGNAAKFSPDGGEIRLTMTVEEQHASRSRRYAVICVHDSGIGIAPEMISRVFELFMQADQSRGRASGGLGIGLSLVRSLVELHGGHVDAFSAGLGRGSEFSVYLPLPAEPVSPPRGGAEGAGLNPADLSRKKVDAAGRVLVVDDSDDIAHSTATLLSLAGYDVCTARDGIEALEVADRFHPGAVILDIGIPGIDGFEVARRLRERDYASDTMLIAVTGYGTDEDRNRAYDAGIDHYLLKPVEIDVLERMLSELRPQ